MGEALLYERYGRDDALALFGAEDEARSLCGGQWVVFPRVTLCFSVLGEAPGRSHFDSASIFCWVADQPYHVSDGHVRFVPREVVSGHTGGRSIHLFARGPHDERLFYIGELAPACGFEFGSEKNHGEAHFNLRPALPSQVWAELGGPRLGHLDHASVDAALGRLPNASRARDRLSTLRQVVQYWHGPIHQDDGIPSTELAGLTLPGPLRWWYRWAGRRPDIISGQNALLGPDELSCQDDLLVFYCENQWCYQWGTLLEGDDPPVYGRVDSSDSWRPEGLTLSEHLILACLFESILCHSDYGASTSWLDDDKLWKIIEHISPIPINPWRWGGSCRFFAKEGAFMCAMPNGTIGGKDGCSVWIGARSEHPLQFLKAMIDESWDYVAV